MFGGDTQAIEDGVENLINFHHTRKAAEDATGIVCPYMNDDQIAYAINRLAEGYEIEQAGERSGSAAKTSYGAFNEAMTETFEQLCYTEGSLWQGNIGSCYLQTKLDQMSHSDGDSLVEAMVTAWTEGQFRGLDFSANELEHPRGGQDYVNYTMVNLMAKSIWGDRYTLDSGYGGTDDRSANWAWYAITGREFSQGGDGQWDSYTYGGGHAQDEWRKAVANEDGTYDLIVKRAGSWHQPGMGGNDPSEGRLKTLVKGFTLTMDT